MRYIMLVVSLAVIILMLYFSIKTNWWGLSSPEPAANTNSEEEIMNLRGQDAVDKARETVNSAEDAQRSRAQDYDNNY